MGTATTAAPAPAARDERRPAAILNLLGIVGDALAGMPPLYVSSILGPPWTWIPAFRHRYSEFQMLSPWQPWRAFKFLVSVTVPSIPRTPPAWTPPFLDGWFWQPSLVLQRADQTQSYTSHLDEAWFFINGVATNGALAQLNAGNLADLFHRPITLLQDATCSLPLDLVECAAGELGARSIECANVAFTPIYDALKERSKSRVVVIAHSGGTIVMATVLAWLKQISRVGMRPVAMKAFAAAPWPAQPVYVLPDDGAIDPDDFDPITDAEWRKLEVYCFANCAKEMQYALDDPPAPWIESLGNQYDLVARLGMFASKHCVDGHGVRIDGPRYRRDGAWGHLLGEHYLASIDDGLRPHHSRRRGGRRDQPNPYALVPDDAERFGGATWPRLFDYINGGTPPALSPDEWSRIRHG